MVELSEMTPEMLEEIWWEGYRRKSLEWTGINKVVQTELRMAGWHAVLDAMISASDSEWARRYLAMRAVDGVDGGGAGGH